jgi:hypothetical protein
MTSTIRIFACLVLVAFVGVAGCGGDDEEELGGARGLGGGEDAAKKEATKTEAEKSAAAMDTGPVVFTDDDFAELDIQNRDPFRSYAKAFKAQAAAPAQRRVLMPHAQHESR